MYQNGLGVEKDEALAVQWYLKGAEQGNKDAQYNLGTLYSNSKGALQNSELAMSWYLKAANQGDADASYNIGILYYKGKGVVKDYGQAYVWFSRAELRGDKDALAMKRLCTEKMTASELKKANDELAADKSQLETPPTRSE